MNRSFYHGVSGSKTYMSGLDTIANNIANVNTVGFKGRETEFSTLFSQALHSAGKRPTFDDMGLGSRLAATPLDLSQGSLVASDRTFDLAIAGDGWFAVRDEGELLYTRNGAFSVAGDEYLTSATGSRIQGVSGNIFRPDPGTPGRYLASLNESIPLSSTGIGDIFLPQQVHMPGEATSEAFFKGNINPTLQRETSRIPIPDSQYRYTFDPLTNEARLEGTVSATDTLRFPKPGEVVYVTVTNSIGKTIEMNTALDSSLHWSMESVDLTPLDPGNYAPLKVEVTLMSEREIPNSAHFQMPIFTTGGEKALIDMRFDQRIPNTAPGSAWDAEISILQFFETYDATKTYDPDAFLVDTASKKVYRIIDTQEGTVRFNENGAFLGSDLSPLNNGGTPLALSLGTPYDPAIPNSGYDGLTTFAGMETSGLSSRHDGYEAGDLRGYIATENGTIYANFNNGKSSAVARIPIFHFRNDQGLSGVGDLYFRPTSNSGDPFLYTDAAGNPVQGAVLHSYSLESSNVRLSTALTEMIVMQKAFDANARSITTSDQMIQKAINMKK